MLNTNIESVKLKIALAFLAICLIWGSTFLAIRFALESLPPVLLGAFRFFIAGAALYIYGRIRGAEKPALTQTVSSAVAGVLLLSIGSTGIVLAERSLPSGQVSLLTATVPVFVALIQWLRPGGSFPGSRVVLGLLIGLAGLAILLGPSTITGDHTDPVAVSFVLFAALGAAAGAIYARSANLPKSQFIAAGVQMVTAGITLFVISLWLGELDYVRKVPITMKSLLSLAYLILFGSMLAYSAYTWLLKTVSPSFASTYTYVNPVIAVLLGWALAGESVTAHTWIGAGVILVSVWLITRAPQSGKRNVSEVLPPTTRDHRTAGIKLA